MKNTYKLLSIVFLLGYQPFTLCAKSLTAVGINPYTYSPQSFESEDGVMGYYWKGNDTPKYPGKAFIKDAEYKKITVLPEGKSPKKSKKLVYLGNFAQMTSENNIILVYNIYGKPVKKEPTLNGPDADVRAFQRERQSPFESDSDEENS